MTAPCATRPDLDWHDPADYPRAALVCSGCPVRARCESDARARGETAGMWGGEVFDVPEPAGFLLLDQPEPVVEVAHGTRTARNSGCVCLRCKASHSAYVRAWRARGADVTEAERFEQTAIDWEVA